MRSLHRALGGLLLATVALSAACGRSAEKPPSRLIVLGLDGVDPEVVSQLVAEGELPNFRRLRAAGATGHLHVEPPLLSPIIWTTIATGRRPSDHGIGHFVATLGEGGEKVPVTSNMRRVRAVWNLFSEARKRVAVVGWWATWPAETVDGTIVSDRLYYHFLGEVETAGQVVEGLVTPESYLGEATRRVRPMESLTREELASFMDPSAIDLSRPFDFLDNFSHLRWAIAASDTYRDIGLDLWRRQRPELLMVYIEGVDTVSHLFGHLYRRHDLAGELAEQQRVYGGTVEAMYRQADAIVGEFLAAMDERTTLVVLSDHGFELGELPEDPSATRDARRVSERYHRSEATFQVLGPGIEAGSDLGRIDPLDVTPTLLALAGLPAARDMPGRVLPLGSPDHAFEELPRIASYESGEKGPRAAPAQDAAADRALTEKLTALGYLGGPRSSGNDRNLAFLALQERRPADAARQFGALLRADPEDAALENGLASALAELGRDEEALAHFARAIELDPLQVAAYHNRGILLERLGRLDEALADYRTALRYEPSYEPSRRALSRLNASADSWQPESAAEQRAKELVAAAGQEMRRGGYARASELLDEALRLAPEASAVHQQIANVAYLSGDFAAATAATARALELDPDNARLRANLEALRRRHGGETGQAGGQATPGARPTPPEVD